MMAIRNNKGISLVDLIIAIAVMALLLTPIILQTATTLTTSAKSKEKQYVIDSATGVMEYFNQSTIQEIDSNKISSGVVEFAPSTLTDPNPKKSVVTCKVTVNGEVKATIDYNAYDYKLVSTKLGRAKHDYERAVVMSDLANRLLFGKASNSVRYRINYNVTPGSVAYTNIYGKTLTASGEWDIQSDHSAVVFDDSESVKRHIVAVECVEVTEDDYIDPNDVSLGNIQNLDSDKIAIIEGDATKLDYKFESDLIKKILDYASRNAGVIDEAILEDTNTLNGTIRGIIRNEANKFSRLITIAVVHQKDSTGKEYYHVDCDVTFFIQFANSSYAVFNGRNEGQITYNVMDRDFYTSEPPDVYMIYEPFMFNTSDTDTMYADDDYICIKSDKYTSGTVDGYDPAKIYLIKPESSWQSTKTNIGPNFAEDTSYAARAKNMYYTSTTSGFVPVNINLNYMYGDVVQPDGSVEHTDSTEASPLQVVTNITSYKWSGKYYPNKISDILGTNQFSLEKAVDIQRTGPTTLKQLCPSYSSGNDFYLSNKYSSTSNTRAAYSETLSTVKKADGSAADSIVIPQNDDKYNGKLYNITVIYKDQNGSLTYLTGAKGAD